MKLKYTQDFIRCSGKDCVHKYKCERSAAYIEAKDNDLAYGKYIQSKDCIENWYSEMIVSNEPKVSE